MGNKDRDEITEDLSELEPSDAAKEHAQDLAEKKSASGTVVTKYQLCGKYCKGCPHGPYAYAVDSTGWTYLGKVGSSGGTDTGTKSYQQNESDSPNSMNIDLPDWVENPSEVNRAIGKLDEKTIEENDDHVVVRGTRDGTDISFGVGTDGRLQAEIGMQSLQTTDAETANTVMDTIAGFPDNPHVEDVSFKHGGTTVQTDTGSFEVDFHDSVGDKVRATVGDFASKELSEAVDDIDRQRRAAEYESDSHPDGASEKVGLTGVKNVNGEEKVRVNIDYEDKDDLKALDRAEPRWDGDDWTIDASSESIEYVVDELEGKGYSVRKSAVVNMLADE